MFVLSNMFSLSIATGLSPWYHTFRMKITYKKVSDMKHTTSQTGKFDYKWVIIALCFLMVFTALGFCNGSKSLYLTAITRALDIKRSAFSIADSCRYISTAVVNIFFGALVARFGSKKLIFAGFFCLIISCILYATATNVFVFYIGGCFLGIGFSWTTTTMVSRIVNKWCTNNRGTITGATLCASGIGGAVSTQLVSPIIHQEGNPFGYRQAYWLVTGILLVVCILITVFYRENPPATQKTDSSPAKSKKKRQYWSGMTFAQARRTPYFYLITASIFLCGVMLQGMTSVSAAHMEDVGLDVGFVATVISIHSLILTSSKFLTGFLYDRRGLRATVTVCDICAVTALLLMLFMNGNSKLLAILFAPFSAFSLPLETVMLPILASDLFGDKDSDKLLGIFVSANTLGFAMGAPLMNWAFDTFGTYRPVFTACAIIMIVVTSACQYIITAAHTRRNKICATSQDM